MPEFTAPLVRMLEAMRSEGLSPVVCSGYRTKEKQEALFESEVQNQIRQGVPEAKAYDEAKKYVSVPNSGEHRWAWPWIFMPQIIYS